MLPRLLSPQFGLLDDGAMLREVVDIAQGNFSMANDIQAGRFRPLYWLYFTIIYVLAGANPFWFFFGQLILFMSILLLIQSIMRKMQANEWEILLTSSLFIFSVPIIENFYTLSKSEPLQLTFLLLSIFSFEGMKKASGTKERWFYISLSFLSILAASLTKETTVIMAPLTILWTGVIMFQRHTVNKSKYKAYLLFTCSVCLAIILSLLIQRLWSGPIIIGGSYTSRYSFSLIETFRKSARWLTLFAFYFHFLLPLSLVYLTIIIKKGFKFFQRKSHLSFWLIWVFLWFIFLIPWEFAEIYYLLPFSLGITILIGLSLKSVVAFLGVIKTPAKITLLITLLVSILLFLTTLTHYRTHAKAQVIFDYVNYQMLDKTHKLIPSQGYFFTGMDANNEYVRNIYFLLTNVYQRNDILYDYTSLLLLETLHEYSNAIIIFPFIETQPRLLLRAGVEEEFTMWWSNKQIETLEPHLTLIEKQRQDFRLLNINLPVILCPIIGEIGYCTTPDPLFDTRIFSFGWDIYRIK